MTAKTETYKFIAWFAVLVALVAGKMPPESRLAWLSSVGMDLPRHAEVGADGWRAEMRACQAAVLGCPQRNR